MASKGGRESPSSSSEEEDPEVSDSASDSSISEAASDYMPEPYIWEDEMEDSSEYVSSDDEMISQSDSDVGDYQDYTISEDSYSDDCSENESDKESLLNDDIPGSSKPPYPNKHKVLPLKDMAARVVAQNMTFEDLKRRRIDWERPLNLISFWAFPQDKKKIKAKGKQVRSSAVRFFTFPRRRRSWRSHSVTKIQQIGFMLICVVDEVEVAVTFEKQQIISSWCGKCGSHWCKHVVCAVCYRIEHANEVPMQAPISKLLSCMSRDQLHKLIQSAVTDDPCSALAPFSEGIVFAQDLRSKINRDGTLQDCTNGQGVHTLRKDENESLASASRWILYNSQSQKSRDTMNDPDGEIQIVWIGQSRSTPARPKPYKHGLLSLLDASARVVAKHMSCDDLEAWSRIIPLDEEPLERVAFWAVPEDRELVEFDASLARGSLIQSEHPSSEYCVTQMRQIGFIVTCKVDDLNVAFTFEKQRITSGRCTGCHEVWCDHVVAAVASRIQNTHMVPVSAPLTYILQRLNKDQLERLIMVSVTSTPVSVLGPLLGRIEWVRNCDVNALPGAPDITYGTDIDEDVHWKRTLDQFRTHLAIDLLQIGNNKYFVDSFIEAEIKASHLHSYIERVKQYVSIGRTETAGDILVAIGNVAASVPHEELTDTEGKKWIQFLWYLERFFTQFIMGESGNIRNVVLSAARAINKMLPSSTARTDFNADRPLIALDDCFEHGCDILQLGNPLVPFHEPLCATHLRPADPALHALLNGYVSPLQSDYDEPLSVMMLRLEGLQIWDEDDGNVKDQVARLALHILQKLLNQLSKYSVFRNKCENCTGHDQSERVNTGNPSNQDAVNRNTGEMHSLRHKRKHAESQEEPRGLSQEKKIKYSDCPDFQYERKSTPDFDYSDADGSSKPFLDSLNPIKSCLLSTCSTLNRLSTHTKVLNKNTTEMLCLANMVAFELDRSESIAESVDENRTAAKPFEHFAKESSDWIDKQIRKQTDFLKILGVYLKEILENSKTFRKRPPIVLIGLLVKYKPQRALAADACRVAMQVLGNPLRQNSVHDALPVLRPSVELAFKEIFRCIQDLHHDGCIGSKLICHAFDSLLECKADCVLEVFHNVWKDNKFRELSKNPSMHIRLLDFFFHCLRLKKQKLVDSRWFSGSEALSHIEFAITSCFGYDYITPYLWDEIYHSFTEEQMNKLFSTMKSTVIPHENEILTANMSKILLDYFENKMKPTDVACQWFELLPSSGPIYNEAVEKIRRNSDNCPASVLLQIARSEYRNTCMLVRKDVFTVDVAALIRTALRKLESEILCDDKDLLCKMHKPTRIDLGWIVCTLLCRSDGMDTIEGPFREFIDLAADCLKARVADVISLFSALESMCPCDDWYKPKLSKTMAEAYVHAFEAALGNRYFISGQNLFTAMKEAKRNFKKFHRFGQDGFKRLVSRLKKNAKIHAVFILDPDISDFSD